MFKLKRDYKILFFLFFSLSFINICTSQNIDILLNKFLKGKMEELESTWNTDGYWGQALSNKDNRYNEAITFYMSMEKDTNLYYKNRIYKAIKFSFKNLQDNNGALLQENKPSHIRTSLFLYGISKVSFKYPQILQEDFVQKGLKKACDFLKTPQEFSSNHNIAALLAFFSLYQATCDIYYYKLFQIYRENILNNYISIDRDNGYWPEAPKNWSNRLNTPYLFVQSFLLNEYLMLNQDKDLLKLFNNLDNFIYNNLDVDNCTIDVSNSIGGFSKKGIKNLKFSVAAFFMLPKIKERLTPYQRRKVLLKCFKHFEKEHQKASVLLYTDTYFRFAAIKNLR